VKLEGTSVPRRRTAKIPPLRSNFSPCMRGSGRSAREISTAHLCHRIFRRFERAGGPAVGRSSSNRVGPSVSKRVSPGSRPGRLNRPLGLPRCSFGRIGHIGRSGRIGGRERRGRAGSDSDRGVFPSFPDQKESTCPSASARRDFSRSS
jgi:hypothetical protein